MSMSVWGLCGLWPCHLYSLVGINTNTYIYKIWGFDSYMKYISSFDLEKITSPFCHLELIVLLADCIFMTGCLWVRIV